MNGLVVAAFKPAYPPIVPTPDAVWNGLAATNVDFSFTVPSFIEVRNALSELEPLLIYPMFTAMGPRSRESARNEEKAWSRTYCRPRTTLCHANSVRYSSSEARCSMKRSGTSWPPKGCRSSTFMDGKLTMIASLARTAELNIVI